MLNYFNNRRKKGQSTLEYAILIIIIIGALLSIQVYIKRGIQGRLKSATDDIGDQFDPGNTKSNFTMTRSSETLETFTDGVTESRLTAEEETNDSLSMNIINDQQTFWGADQ
tara:strand:+ start:167 stop:502 length:336 start_codon:yes stop_codon:yes gene_type:complete